jgi:pimeloyl-ACP methyl ester carboxylesterase
MNEGAIPSPAKNPKARLKSFSPEEGASYFRSADIKVFYYRRHPVAPFFRSRAEGRHVSEKQECSQCRYHHGYSSSIFAQTSPESTVKSGHAPVNGLKLYYEIRGSGEPLILLHGGVVGITMFGQNLDLLSQKRKVIAIELQGHGHTADIDRPLSYEAMADDVAGLLKYLGIGKADVMGYSLGGEVALQVVIRHPELVRKLVVVSAAFRRDGYYPEVLTAFDQMGASAGEQMKQSPLAKMYPNVNWPQLFAKLGDLLRKNYDWSKEVAAIKPPTILVFADADAVRPAHVVEFYGLLGSGQRDAGFDGSKRSADQLAILPGLTH